MSEPSKIVRGKLVVGLAVALLLVGIVGAVAYNKRANNSMGLSSRSTTQNQTPFRLDLRSMAGATYPVNQPSELTFNIRTPNNKVFIDFALDNTKLMHIIVVRKDRSNFQHVHPAYDSKTGLFTQANFTFPTDGEYRVYANFTPTGAKKDAMGMIESEAPYQDVKVGDVGKYTPQPLGSDDLSSTVHGFTASFKSIPNDDSPGSISQTFTVGQYAHLAISIDKNNQPFTNLQPYLGALGHVVILGPNLEFIHAHPLVSDIKSQSGLITFVATFPVSGQYKLYLQTQADNQISTFDFNLTVHGMPKATSSTGNSMPGMNH